MRVLIADGSREFCDALARRLDGCGFSVVGTAVDGEQVLALAEQTRPELLVLDLMLPQTDGIRVLRQISGLPDPPITVATSAFVSPFVASSAAELGVRYILRKPLDLETLVDRLMELQWESTGVLYLPGDGGDSVPELLQRIGVPANLKGFRYLHKAACLVLADPLLMDAVTGKLYPAVAEAFNTTDSRVERDIRHAIDVAWARGDRSAFRYLFSLRRKPTNAELIALLANKAAVRRVNVV